MLERLCVRHFRGFENLEVDQLRRINLVAGRNDAGKSTLLEAIFLLGSAGNPQLAVNTQVTRYSGVGITVRESMAEAFWRPLFFTLDTDGAISISGRHSAIGNLELTIGLDRHITTEVPRNKTAGALTKARAGERLLTFAYTDPEAGIVRGHARETAETIAFDRTDDEYTAFATAMLESGHGDIEEDAVNLARLRRRKHGGLLLEALQVVDSRLQSIEDNASSGTPMIWVDIGLSELLPLPVMGHGLTHVARLVLGATEVQNGVLLVDEIENGLHYAALWPASCSALRKCRTGCCLWTDVWRAVSKAVERFNVQVFATTHSFECVQAAHTALGPDGFRLHRLETVGGRTRCVTYNDDAIEGVVRHNREFR